MIEPLDIGTVRFFLRFESLNAVFQIAEPIKFDACNFVVEQDDKRLGRDVSFAGGKANLRFSPMCEHEFDRLLSEYNKNGFEADVKFIIEIEDVRYVIGQLDFAEAETDLVSYFDCKVIQENKQALIKRRSKVKVDLLSGKDLDGNDIEPCPTERVYLRATPLSQKSSWKMAYDEPKSYPSPASPSIFFNPAPFIVDSGIENTLSPSPDYMQLSNVENPALEDYAIVEAANTLQNCVLQLSGKWDFSNCVAFVLRIKKGVDFASSEYIYIHDMNLIEDNFQLQLDIATINRNEKLYLYFNAQSINYSPSIFYDFKVSLQVNSISLSSLIETFNLGEAMRQVIRSISGLEIDAPRFLDPNGEFKKQYITDGLRIRNILDQPFNISLDDILEYLLEIRGDYEVGEDAVFFGIFKDFYRDERIGSFDMLPNEDFKVVPNKEYSVNTFEMKYSKYSDDNEASGSREAVHCKMQMMLPNKMVENNKAVNIGFVRDSFMLENVRKKAIEVNDDTVVSDDTTIFIIDCLKTLPKVRELVVLWHRLSGNNLSLTNDGSFNWEFMGVSVGIYFTIIGNENAGTYTVINITPTTILLYPYNVVPDFQGRAPTRISFTFQQTTFVNRTNEGFDFLEGASTPEGFSNLLFTPKRNIYNYWGNYLLTASMFHKDKKIKMTEFLYNGKLKTAAFGRPPFIVEEGKDISYSDLEMVEDMVLTPFLVQTDVFCDFPTFWELRSKIRTQRGHIEVVTTEGETIEIYPQKLDLGWKNNILTIEGERKN